MQKKNYRMEYIKPIVATISPAIGGNVLGLVVAPEAHFPIIPFLQAIAYLVSIAIGLFQLHKYMKDKHPLMSAWSGLQSLWARYWSPSNPILRGCGDFALLLIPILEGINFSNPTWEDKRLLIHTGLVVVKFITNLSTKKNAGRKSI